MSAVIGMWREIMSIHRDIQKKFKKLLNNQDKLKRQIERKQKSLDLVTKEVNDITNLLKERGITV